MKTSANRFGRGGGRLSELALASSRRLRGGVVFFCLRLRPRVCLPFSISVRVVCCLFGAGGWGRETWGLVLLFGGFTGLVEVYMRRFSLRVGLLEFGRFTAACMFWLRWMGWFTACF